MQRRRDWGRRCTNYPPQVQVIKNSYLKEGSRRPRTAHPGNSPRRYIRQIRQSAPLMQLFRVEIGHLPEGVALGPPTVIYRSAVSRVLLVSNLGLLQ